RQRVALGLAAIVRDGLVASGERHGLERKERNLLGIVERESHHRAHLLIVDAVYDRDHGNDVHAVRPQVLNRTHFSVEQVADGAVRVGGIAYAVELQIGVAQTGFSGLLAKLRTLGELDAVGSRLHAVVADFARVANRIQEVGRARRLAARE